MPSVQGTQEQDVPAHMAFLSFRPLDGGHFRASEFIPWRDHPWRAVFVRSLKQEQSMTKRLDAGKRRFLGLPKAKRKRTRLDENFDEMRAILTSHGATLETAMEALYKMRRETE